MKSCIALLLSFVFMLSAVPFISATPSADAPTLDGATFVTFGDSITALSTWPRAVAKGTNMHLINAGIGGNTTDQGRARFERDVLSRNPDFVTISFATNDFYLEDGTNPRVTVAKYKENLQYFIAEIKAIGGTPILVTPPFLSDDSQGGSSLYPEGSVNLALDKYVVAMREVASSTGTHLIDMHAVCDSGYDLNTFLIADGLHLADQGNQVYTDTMVAYLKEHFNQDASAPRVTTNDPPALEQGAWTKSLIPFHTADWLVLFPGTVNGTENTDGSISFANTTGLWPEVHYSPGFSDMFYAPVSQSRLTIDMELTASANVSLYFDGPTPTHEYTNTSVALAPILQAAFPNVKVSGYDICGGQHFRVTLPLSDVVPQKYIRSDGTVLLSGVKIFVAGAANAPITFNELSVTANGGNAPTHYTDKQSLLPTSSSAVSDNEGVVDYSITDNTFTIARSAQSDIAWPSVKVQCGQTVDLHQTPYLHIKLTSNGGSANGFINYTDAYGNSGSVRISEMINGTANDLTADTDVYVHLANAVQNGGTITIDSYILSVYGVAGDGVTWQSLATAKEMNGMPGDINANGKIDTSDATALLRHLNFTKRLDDTSLEVADCNGDGKLNTTDVRYILLELVKQ